MSADPRKPADITGAHPHVDALERDVNDAIHLLVILSFGEKVDDAELHETPLHASSALSALAALARDAAGAKHADRHPFSTGLAAMERADRAEAERDLLARELVEAKRRSAIDQQQADDMTDEAGRLSRRVEELERAVEDAIAHMPGHDHWREGGVGGLCLPCVRGRELLGRLRAVLVASTGPEGAAE